MAKTETKKSTGKKKGNTELKENTGFLHLTVDKTMDSAPDYFGSLNIDGKNFKLAGWKKAPEEKDKNSFISLNLDDEDLSPEDSKKTRDTNLSDFKKERNKKENKDKFLLIEGTGTIHKSKPEAPEDFFGTVMIFGEKKYLKGFASETKKKSPVIRLEISDGTRSKEERGKIAESFI
jgi:hypothetical protein